MTTCKDCVHFEACKNIYEIHGDGLSEESYGCDQFSNRSKLGEELVAMKKQLKEIKKENEQLWKYIKSVERLANMW